MRYDPDKAPIPSQWLALDETRRVSLVKAHHRATRTKLPHATMHATVHVVIENQLAEGLKPVTNALSRLLQEGLSRHDAIHAIGSVLAEHLFEILNTDDPSFLETANAKYLSAVESLTLKSWESKYGS